MSLTDRERANQRDAKNPLAQKTHRVIPLIDRLGRAARRCASHVTRHANGGM
jgi:hypothetical protein